jgi:mannose-6-phosphate isomerase-like protein (cupin superfamily)
MSHQELHGPRSGRTPSPWNAPRSWCVPGITPRSRDRRVDRARWSACHGEHRHPSLVEQFTVLEGELTAKRDEQTSILHQGETVIIEPGVWHDWWNAGNRDARLRLEVTPSQASGGCITVLSNP